MLYFKLNHYIEAWALDVMPIWLQDLIRRTLTSGDTLCL